MNCYLKHNKPKALQTPRCVFWHVGKVLRLLSDVFIHVFLETDLSLKNDVPMQLNCTRDYVFLLNVIIIIF